MVLLGEGSCDYATGYSQLSTNSLYRGMVPPLLGVTPIFAMSFWASINYTILITRLSEPAAFRRTMPPRI
jgi:hypothetical protein